MSDNDQRGKGPQKGKRGNQGKDQKKGGFKGKNPFANDSLQKDLDSIAAKQKDIKAKVQDAHDRKKALIEEKKQYNEKNKAEFDGITEITPKLNEIKKQEKQIKDKVAKQKEERQRFYDEVNNLLTLPRKDGQSLEDRIQANIESLENELKSLREELREIKSLREEKQITSSIAKTNAKLAQVAALKERRTNTNTFGQKLQEFREKKQPLGDQIGAHKKVIDANKAKVAECDKKIDAITAEISGYHNERNELNDQYAEKKAALQVKKDAYYKEQEVVRKKEAAEREARNAEYKKKKAEEEKKRKEEEANRPPLLKEVEDIDNVAAYLKRIRFNKKKPNAKLTHSLDALTMFSAVGMTPPRTGKQIEEYKVNIAKKKEEILAKQAELLKQRAEEAEKKAAEAETEAEVVKDAAENAEKVVSEANAEETKATEEKTETKEEPASEEPAAEETKEKTEEAQADEAA